jgi:LmbE family N-acetylglucosaminyl deacetylase|tara:strand:+ start:7504 stop:8361 length:858 start_codon:yes stop_codon:yes gene_type:complete
MNKKIIIIFAILLNIVFAQPDVPVDQWKGKKILLIGAHPDDDSQSYGTLAMLRDHGNEVWVLLLTTGNVGTKDPKMTRDKLSKIRLNEEIDALKILGIDKSHYINLGYTDGEVEWADRKEVVGKIVRWIRKIRPDVLMAFDPGWGYVRWHKTDHRTASYLAADASRAAEWRLIFPAQIIHEGLKEWRVPEYLFYSPLEKDANVTVDITKYNDKKVTAKSKHLSQFSGMWDDYRGNDPKLLSKAERKEFNDRISRMKKVDGKIVENFRYYTGYPDGIGSGRGSYPK